MIYLISWATNDKGDISLSLECDDGYISEVILNKFEVADMYEETFALNEEGKRVY